ncbi:hypothetical protein O988_02662 [Pseudogymnoascus sp. VKM F-3808]|nr:hypothetical protein O988_02662 [Pseudogymnoascus sp. VKM F-3808]
MPLRPHTIIIIDDEGAEPTYFRQRRVLESHSHSVPNTLTTMAFLCLIQYGRTRRMITRDARRGLSTNIAFSKLGKLRLASYSYSGFGLEMVGKLPVDLELLPPFADPSDLSDLLALLAPVDFLALLIADASGQFAFIGHGGQLVHPRAVLLYPSHGPGESRESLGRRLPRGLRHQSYGTRGHLAKRTLPNSSPRWSPRYLVAQVRAGKLKRKPCILFILAPATIILAVIIAVVAYVTIKAKKHPNLNIDLGYTQYKGFRTPDGIDRWLGMRYAAPPLGDLRFRAPKDPLQASPQTADKKGKLCHATPSTHLNPTRSEDCLFIDVYSPTDRSTLHPVYFFIQGGGFNDLSNPYLTGDDLIRAADNNIVVVTSNYRVGPWGFLASKEVKEDGDLNVGLLDQRKAMAWVQKYIHLFGGDPNHVTIDGDSAGAASVDLHLTAYGGRDDKLFHAAAGQSNSFGSQLTVNESQYQYDGLVNRTNCNTSSDTLTCLRELDVEVIASHNINMPTPGAKGTPLFMYSNVIDGPGGFTEDYTYNMYADSKFVKVPVIFGSVSNEGTLFVPPRTNTVTEMKDFLKNNFAKLTTDQLSHIVSLYPQDKTKYPGRGPWWRTTADAYGELRYICPGQFMSQMFENHTDGTSNWNYHWDVAAPVNIESGMGSMHAASMYSIFNIAGGHDAKLNPIIQAYWTSFIRTKNPNTHRLPGTAEWGTFGTARERIHFPNDPNNVAMETVGASEKTRCQPLPKGRQGRSANVISALRASQIGNIHGSIAQRDKNARPPRSPEYHRTPGLLSSDTIDACSNFYFADFYSTLPVLQREMLDYSGDIMNTTTETYYLIVSFCAFIIIQTGSVHHTASKSDGSLLQSDVSYGQALINEALEARKSANPLIIPSVEAVVTSFLLYGSYRSLNDQSKAWFFLREATTLYMSSIIEGNTQRSLGSNQLFWLLLITERSYAIRKHRPLTLLLSSSSPDIAELGNEIAASGFVHLVNLFRPIDELFIGLWNGTLSACSVDWLVSLDEHMKNSASPTLDISDIELVNLLVTQQWLRLIVWQLSNNLGFLSSVSTHGSLNFQYPIQIAQDLTILIYRLPQQSMEIHGIGLVEKLFDVAYVLVDVIAYTPPSVAEPSITGLGPKDYLTYILSLVAKLRGGEDRFLPLLLEKVSQILPNFHNPLTWSLPLASFLENPASPSEQISSNGDEGRVSHDMEDHSFLQPSMG